MTLTGTLLACPVVVSGEGPEDNARGKISRNFYRIPYVTGTEVKVVRDYVDHGVSQDGSSSDAGKIDMNAVSGDATLVAAADGEVTAVFDANNDCGCNAAFGGCANKIEIRHDNGEVSRYLHIAQDSALVDPGDLVVQGQPIATEGDVGYTCNTAGSAPRAGVCLPAVPPGTGNCGRHLHWEVFRETTDEYVNPTICGVSGSIFQDNGTYTSGGCVVEPDACSDNVAVSGSMYSGFGTFEVRQANDTITAGTTTVEDLASMVLHAGNKVTLEPGFRVVAEAYFRVEVGECNDTAPTPP